jgi:putative glycosyltransferase (TIGR04372 family)
MNLRLLTQELNQGLLHFIKIRIYNDRFFFEKKILFVFLVLILSPISFFIYLLKWRYCDIYSNRIGHQVAEYFYINSIKNGFKPFTIHQKSAANKHLYEYYEYVRVVRIEGFLKLIASAIYTWPWLRIDVENSIRTNKFRIFNIKNNNHKKLSLKDADIKRQSQLLMELNIKVKEYVCFHVRQKGFSQIDDERFAYRNSTFEKINEAIKYCNSRGLQVVVVGDNNHFNCSKVINYPNTTHKSEINDLLLIAGAKYFIGNTSGLHLLAWAFDVEVLLLNVIPYHSEPYFKDIKFIRKNLVFNKQINSEMMERLDNAYSTEIFVQFEVEVVENTSIQILNFLKKHIK